MTSSVLVYGSTEPLPKNILLNAGNLNLIYEAGFLRYIKCGDKEVLRMINYMVRDHNWGTVPMKILQEQIDQQENHFVITYQAESVHDSIDFYWNCRIEGGKDSSVVFEIEGEAKSTFKRNRLGFTVLHPVENCAGKQCIIRHSNATEEALTFPEFISPHQPFFDITAMHWGPSSNILASLEFEGEIFETEDQRNWLDASYKTYCTPLSIPFPVVVNKGDKIRQLIRLQVKSSDKVVVNESKQITIQMEDTYKSSLPRLGISLSDLDHNQETITRLKELNADFLSVRVRIGAPDMKKQISHFLKMSEVIGLPLELITFFDREVSPDFVDELLPLKESLEQIIVLPAYAKCSDQALIDQVVPVLRKNFNGNKIGGGTDAFFTELNRERTPAASLDFLSFSVNPQVHAFDNSSLTETLPTHASVVQSCRQFSGGKDIHVGPVSFKMRWNPNATGKDNEHFVNGLPKSADPRQISLYGAAWTLGSLKYLAESNVASVTLYETCGWKGFIPHPQQPWPEAFGFLEKGVYPVYLLLKEILKNKDAQVVKLVSSDPLLVDGLIMKGRAGKESMWLANYTQEPKTILLPPNTAHSVSAVLQPSTIIDSIAKAYWSDVIQGKSATHSPMLPPFSITRLDRY